MTYFKDTNSESDTMLVITKKIQFERRVRDKKENQNFIGKIDVVVGESESCEGIL